MNAIIIFCAQYLPYVMGAALIAVCLWPIRRYRMGIVALVSAGITRVLVKPLIVFFWHRQRPYIAMPSLDPLVTPVPGEAYASFPSGHAIFFFALAMAVYRYDKKLGAWFFVGATINGIARVAAGLHYTSDIIAGAILGILTAIIVTHFFPPLKPSA